MGFMTMDMVHKAMTNRCPNCGGLMSSDYWYCAKNHQVCVNCHDTRGVTTCNYCPSHPQLRFKKYPSIML